MFFIPIQNAMNISANRSSPVSGSSSSPYPWETPVSSEATTTSTPYRHDTMASPLNRFYTSQSTPSSSAARSFTPMMMMNTPTANKPSPSRSTTNSAFTAWSIQSDDSSKFRQLPCKTFISVGACPYRDRCKCFYTVEITLFILQYVL